MLNRRTINETNSQATPVTRKSHHGNIEAPRTRVLTAPSPRTVRPDDGAGQTSDGIRLGTAGPPVMVRNG